MTAFLPMLLALLFSLASHATSGTCGKDLTPDEQSELRVRAAIDHLYDGPGDGESRVNDLATLFAEGRRAMRQGSVERGLQRRLRVVTPTLYRHLFDADVRVQWAAAYALAGHRNSDFSDDLVGALQTRSPEVECRMRDELESYLVAIEAVLFQYVDLEDVTDAGTSWRFNIRVRTQDDVPIVLDGRTPRAPRPSWLKDESILNVVVHEQDGRVYQEEWFKGDTRERLDLSGRFTVDLPKDVDFRTVTLYFDFKLDRRVLERMMIKGSVLRDEIAKKTL